TEPDQPFRRGRIWC
ncbi:MAG: cyanobactin biosynthesis PatC/TenC/TruC family protein, partial [Dolichospermum sp.]